MCEVCDLFSSCLGCEQLFCVLEKLVAEKENVDKREKRLSSQYSVKNKAKKLQDFKWWNEKSLLYVVAKKGKHKHPADTFIGM